MKNILPFLALIIVFTSCQKDPETTDTSSDAMLRIQFKFDPNQVRLDNLGGVSTIPDGHAAQNPDFNALSAYFIELVPTKFTQIREGAVIYEAASQVAQPGSSFETAVKFDEALVSDEGIYFLEIPIKDIPPGEYEYLRASVTYQNADVRFNLKNLPDPLPSELNNQFGTITGFIGFNSHIKNLTVKHQTISIEADKTQGFWAFEPQLDEPYQGFYETYVNQSGVITGQAPAGLTTVVNPLAAFGVELPFGSCIVTGEVEGGLVVRGNETEGIDLTLSFSINQSFEWVDDNGNGEWDMDIENQTVEQVVDMGLRGLIVKKN